MNSPAIQLLLAKAFSWLYRVDDLTDEELINLMIATYQTGSISKMSLLYETLQKKETDNKRLRQLIKVFRWFVRLSMGHAYTINKEAQRPFERFPLINYRPEDREEIFDGKTIVLLSVYCAGEVLLFASLFQEILQNNKLVCVLHDPRFMLLFPRSFPKATFEFAHPSLYRRLKPRVDDIMAEDSILLESFTLPFLLRASCSDFPPNPKPYIIPDASEAAKWKKRYAAIGDSPKVGIAWFSPESISEPCLRSTALKQWEKVLSVPGVQFISLQGGNHAEELSGVTVHNWEDSEPWTNFDDLAAQIAALDVVISLADTPAYMAGALGIPVMMILPAAESGEWYDYVSEWFNGFDDVPIFPSMRTFRQETPGDWVPVLERVADELRHFVKTGTMQPVNPENSYRTAFALLEEDHE